MMRRINDFLILLLLLLATASCNKRDKITVKNDVKITLRATAVGDTKGRITDKDHFISTSYGVDGDGPGFGVYGYKSYRNSDVFVPQVLLFNNTEVNPNSEGPDNVTWTYTPIRYWDSNTNAYYQFVAYWPHLQSHEDPNNATAPWVEDNYVVGQTTTGNMKLTINNIPNWQNSADPATIDFMVATSKGKYKGYESETNIIDLTDYSSTIVPFTFNHILANLIIKAYYFGVEDSPISIHGITLERNGNGLLATNGIADYYKPYGGNTASPSFSTLDKTGTSQVLFNAATTAAVKTLPTTAFYDVDHPENNTNFKSEDICDWLVIPTNNWNGLKLKINYAIGDAQVQPTEIPVGGINIGTDPSYEMLSGKSYVITLKFDSTSGNIDLETVYVKDWEELVDVDHDVYNW